MAPDSTTLAASVAKSVEVERLPSATQRASEIAQEQIADESVHALTAKKPSATDQLQRQKIRQDHERRRRELERRAAHPDSGEEDDPEGGPILDVVA